MKKTATIIRMTRPVNNGMYTDKYTVTYEPAETLETKESEVNEMNNEMYINNEYRAEYRDEDLDIWVTLDDLTHMTANSELEAIETAVEYLAYSDIESGECEDIDEAKAKWYAVEWRAALEINPEYNACYNWKYE